MERKTWSATCATRPRLRHAATVMLLGLTLPGTAFGGTAMEAIRTTSEAIFLLLRQDGQAERPGTEARRQELLQIIDQRFSYEEMAKRVLGSQWTRLGPTEREEFVELFKQLLTGIYLSKIEGYGKERVEYLSERDENGYAEVRTRIVSRQGSVPMDFRLILQAGEWRVYDLLVDGISLVNNYRGQFSRFLRLYSYPELVMKLRERAVAAP